MSIINVLSFKSHLKTIVVTFTLSACCRYCNWCVTRITVLFAFRSRPMMPLRNKWPPTFTSRADRGSSYKEEEGKKKQNKYILFKVWADVVLYLMTRQLFETFFLLEIIHKERYKNPFRLNVSRVFRQPKDLRHYSEQSYFKLLRCSFDTYDIYIVHT